MNQGTGDLRYPWLEEQISGGATIVTASRRLARDLTDVYSARQVESGMTAWQTPPIIYWPDWLSRTFSAVEDPPSVPRRLDPLSATMLWERCLRRRVNEGVLNFGGVVRQSMQAWQRLCEWDVPVQALLASASTDDERLFAGAANEYFDLLLENNWTDGAGMAAIVASVLSSEPALVPGRLALAGFDRRSPAVGRVIEQLEKHGCEVAEMPAAKKNAEIDIVAYPDVGAELRAAGGWARESLAEDPAANIAIVCPGLEVDAEEYARLIREGLVPGWQFGSLSHRTAANISYGRKLAEYPAIAVALLLLRWASHGLSGAELGVLLRSSAVGSAERGGRSRLELALRSQPDREWSAESFRAAMAGGDDSPDAHAFFKLVEELGALSVTCGDLRLTPTDCVQRIDELLTKAGWPGAAPLDSAGFQLVNRWRELLNEFARIETVTEFITWPEAVARISSLAAESVWQPDVGPGAVKVLGTLEAFGMEFDRIWVCGMDATQWPPASRPLPFVSRALQRERAMPDATPADTLGFATRLLDRLTNAASQCVLSWSEARQDAELTVSTLLDAVVPASAVKVSDPGWSSAALIASAETEIITDDPAPPIAADERVRGGAYTIQRQYTEPFAAFVYGRLGVRTPDAFGTGLSPSMRGNIIHNALHNLLAGNPAQADIAAWSADERVRRVGSAIDAALERHGRHADSVLRRIIALERRRLHPLLAAFLDSELERPAFTVSEVEKAIEFECRGVALGFQIDRTDWLPDGRLLVTDYKTGAPKSFLTQSGDLKDMQLVAYADALGADVAGILFINIDPRDIAMRGAGEGWQDKADPDWYDTFRAWRAQLHDVMAELAAGDVRTDAWKTAAEARALSILSRIEEQKRVD